MSPIGSSPTWGTKSASTSSGTNRALALDPTETFLYNVGRAYSSSTWYFQRIAAATGAVAWTYSFMAIGFNNNLHMDVGTNVVFFAGYIDNT